ncbi:hypothetical protein LOZ80_26030 [Paenibacillus sp. HWE-109]|uniref:hypothetical protein n=1 Tax=Paenibacillus sp. HWE-109 TaxID=1306526 RepID=UPI001EDEA4BD|nr:hypothetical protein [Paenibacillus sp. HWE-109]UKS25040.1 hypothetical protein LOZ80_26030 [Paenibacillus sp. HWE-109]
MKKKPVYRYSMPKGIETKGTANGEVTSSFMNPIELAEWKRGLPARPDHALEKILNRSYKGGPDIA